MPCLGARHPLAPSPSVTVRAQAVAVEQPRRWGLLAFVLVCEILILTAGAATGNLVLAAGTAAFLLFCLIAVHSSETAWTLIWIAFPFSIPYELPGGNEILIPTEPMLIVAQATWLYRLVLTRDRLPGSPMLLPLAAFAGIALTSTAIGRFPILGFKALAVAGAYITFGLLYFLLTPWDRERRERWIRIVLISGAAWGIYGSVRVLLGGGSLGVAYGIARPFFPEHNTYGAFLAMIAPLALVRVVETRGKERILYALAVVAMGSGLLLSYTRAALLSVAVVLPVAMLLWAARRGTLRPLLWPALLTLVLAVPLFATGIGSRLQRHMATTVQAENVSNLERVNRWMAAAEMIRAKPVLGVGYNAYSREYQAYRRKKIFTELVYKKIDTHSEPLRILAETGFLGFGVALWFVGTVLWLGFRVIRSPDRETSALGLALVAGLGTFLVHSFFNSYGATDKVVVPFWTAIGGIAALGHARLGSTQPET